MRLRQNGFVWLAAGLMILACVGTADAQRGRGGPGGRGGFSGGPGGFSMMGRGRTSKFALLERKDVQKELELLDDQIQELKDARQSLDFRNVYQGLRDVPREQRQEKMREALEKVRKDLEAKLNSILLPHQVARLNQLAVQFAVQRPDGLIGGPVAEQLGISDQQREALRDKAQKLEEELRKQLQQKLIGELSSDQQAKLQQLMGKPFTFEKLPPPKPEARFAPGGPSGRGRGRGN